MSGAAGPTSLDDPSDVDRHRRRARRYGILAVVVCPCHLPLTAGLLALVGFGGAAAALRDNLVLVTAVLIPFTALSIWVALRASKTARACALPPPPRAASSPTS